MARTVPVTIIGAGSLGSALARNLKTGGIPVAEIVYRQSAARAKALANSVLSSAVPFENAEFAGNVIWLCVADSEIAATAKEMAKRSLWKGKTIFHSSGALPADELAPLRRRGARIASVHPMMTFVRSASASMKGVWFALEGDADALKIARRLVQQLGGKSFPIGKKDKPLYHALGAFVSPLMVAHLVEAERIGRALKLDARMTRAVIAPILRQTIENYLAQGPAMAFSGPIVRGDAATVRKNLAALKGVRGAGEIYRALAKVAIEELPSKDAKAVRKAIAAR